MSPDENQRSIPSVIPRSEDASVPGFSKKVFFANEPKRREAGKIRTNFPGFSGSLQETRRVPRSIPASPVASMLIHFPVSRLGRRVNPAKCKNAKRTEPKPGKL
jgi:hypothetical protein